MSRYQEWIAENVPASPRGYCNEMTASMVEEFPELRRVRGHYVDVDDRRHPHWWCVTPDGEIVDPTAAQFGVFGEYVEHVGQEPIGKCINCGGYCYDEACVCSDECARDAKAYVIGRRV
jgi:hypothetical protein